MKLNEIHTQSLLRCFYYNWKFSHQSLQYCMSYCTLSKMCAKKPTHAETNQTRRLVFLKFPRAEILYEVGHH